MVVNRLLLFICFVFCMSAGTACAQRVSRYDLPEVVIENFDLAHPNSAWKMVRWELADEGYYARIKLFRKEISTLFQANGEWISTRWTIPESRLPLKAHDFISEKYAFYALRSCSYEEDRWEGRHYYALFSIYGIEGYMTEVCFDLRGNVVSIDGQEIEDLDEFEPLTEEDVLLEQENEMLARLEEMERGSDTLTGSRVKKKRPMVGFFAWFGKKGSSENRLSEQEAVSESEDLSGQEERFGPGERDREIDGSETEIADMEQPETEIQDTGRIGMSSETGKKGWMAFGKREKDRGRKNRMLYKMQSRREFIEARVMVQSKAARKQRTAYEERSLSDRPDTAVRTDWSQPEPPIQRDTLSAIARMPQSVSGLQGQVPMPKVSVKTVFPTPVQEAFDRRFPRAENVKYYRDTNGIYRAVFSNFGQKAEAVILPDGTHTTTALFFGKKDVSYPIQQYIENSPEKYRFATGKRIVYESRYRQRFSAEKKPKNYYQVVVWVKDKKSRGRKYFLLTFDQKAHFVSSSPYDYVGSH